MLEITEDDAHNCFVVAPSGTLSKADFERLTEQFNARMHATDRVPNLVIHARGFPGLQGRCFGICGSSATTRS